MISLSDFLETLSQILCFLCEVGILPAGVVVPAVAGPEPWLPCSLPDQDLSPGNGSPHLSPLLIYDGFNAPEVCAQ